MPTVILSNTSHLFQFAQPQFSDMTNSLMLQYRFINFLLRHTSCCRTMVIPVRLYTPFSLTYLITTSDHLATLIKPFSVLNEYPSLSRVHKKVILVFNYKTYLTFMIILSLPSNILNLMEHFPNTLQALLFTNDICPSSGSDNSSNQSFFGVMLKEHLLSRIYPVRALQQQ